MLSDDALADLGTQGAPRLAKFVCRGDVPLDHIGRWPGGGFTHAGSTRQKNRNFL